MARRISSTFDTGLQGWTFGDTNAYWSESGGDPGGYLAWSTQEIGAYFEAPDRYLGDKLEFFKGNLSFNYHVESNFDYVIISLIASDGTSIGINADLRDGGWHVYRLSLDVKGFENEFTTKEIKHVLSNLSSFTLSVYSPNYDDNGLDNITLATRGKADPGHVAASAFSTEPFDHHAPTQQHLFAGHDHLIYANTTTALA